VKTLERFLLFILASDRYQTGVAPQLLVSWTSTRTGWRLPRKLRRKPRETLTPSPDHAVAHHFPDEACLKGFLFGHNETLEVVDD